MVILELIHAQISDLGKSALIRYEISPGDRPLMIHDTYAKRTV